MRVGLLGELAVDDDRGVDVPIPGAKLRALLAVLALHAGRVVPAEQLVDALWGDEPPEGVRNSLQGLVSKLRRALGSSDLVAMRGGGYVLDLPADAIDAHRFEEQVAEARAAVATGDHEGAVRLLGEADALWRGDALSDFPYEDFATGPIARLTEQRLASLEERLELELRLGRHQAAVVELEELVSAHPLRERLRGLLMLALYRSGRQADALRAFQDGRHLLAEELGLEPGQELRQLESAILSQDPELDAPPAARPVTDTTGARSVIPEALTSLVGRDAELGELVEALADSRLVTLVGPGGVGKTRLALEVARRASAPLPMGGCLVELAPIGDPDGVRPAIAAALGSTDHDRLAEVIGDRGLLLMLDNCEHVIAAAAEVAEDLLRRCPGLQVVATSREGLRVSGEVIWPVPPLAATDAVELFLARSQAAGSTLDGSEDVRAAIREICTRLDGLPLAIELAAARTRAFPVGQLADRLHDRFRLLTGGSRTALPRQQTLRAVVDWSYDLLFEDEQRAFERLAVFPGGCDLATAEAVCVGGDLLADDIPDLIQALVDKSLVLAVPTGGVVRFTQLQTLAQYGREKLAERGEAEAFRNAMAHHFGALCGQSAVAYTGDGQRAWLAAIERDRDNLRAALEWAVSTDDAETAMTIAGGTAWTHWLAATIPEGRRWLDEAFACGGKVSDTTRALGLTGRGLLDFLAGAPERSDADLEEALAIFCDQDDRPSMALARSFYAEIADVRGDVEEALRRRQEVIAFYDGEPDDEFTRAARYWSLGKLGLLRGDLAEAEVNYRAAADGFAVIDRPVMRSISLGMVADFDELAGDHAAAIERLEEAIATNDELGLRGFVGSLLVRLGWALLHTGERDRAHAAYARALEDARRVRNAPVLFLAHAGTAVCHRLDGQDERAERAARQALTLHLAGAPRRFRNRIDRQRDEPEGAAACCTVLAALAATGGDTAGAARFLGHAARLQAESGADAPGFLQVEADQVRELARTALGAADFAAELEAGRTGDLAADLATAG